MKLAITSQGKELDSQVERRFGRAPFFIIADTDEDSNEAVANEAARAGGGAGVKAAEFLIQKGVTKVVTGNVGPNAFQTLSAAGVTILTVSGGSVRDAIENAKHGSDDSIDSPTVGSHHGMR